MATYIGTSINQTATIVLPAGEELTDARGIALAVDDGKVVKPSAGAKVIGIALIETDEVVKEGDGVDIQIKDIGKMVAGEAIAIGTEIAVDADGKAVAAKTGDYVIGEATGSVSTPGSWVSVQVTKSGYKA